MKKNDIMFLVATGISTALLTAIMLENIRAVKFPTDRQVATLSSPALSGSMGPETIIGTITATPEELERKGIRLHEASFWFPLKD